MVWRISLFDPRQLRLVNPAEAATVNHDELLSLQLVNRS